MSSPEPALSRSEVIGSGLCIGCGGCSPAMEWDRDGQWKPALSQPALSAPDAAFARTCPFSPHAANEDAIARALFGDAPLADGRIGRFASAWVGHAPAFRAQGSSGGLVSWVASALLEQGLVDGVAHVGPLDPAIDGRLFGYRISRTVDSVRTGAKSRYYPVELSAMLAEIRAAPGRYAVVGVPCFIKAVRLLCAEDPLLRERVAFTLGLFCGHGKSARMAESFAWQLGTGIGAVAAIDYRLKQPNRPANWYTAHVTLRDGSTRQQDWWHLADGDWGAGFFQNPACDWCDDVVAETADVAFGDAWVEPYASDGRGTNVMIARAPAIDALVRRGVDEGRLVLEGVDAAFVAGTQAAGFRHRREGLGYRLSWRRQGLIPVKRVAPGAAGITARRRLVYATRFAIARGSHHIFRLARRTGRPAIYLAWARAVLAFYRALAWSHGRLGAAFDRVETMLRRSREQA